MSVQATFWARRRAAVQAEEAAEIRARDLRDAEALALEQSEKDDATLLAEMGLPDPEGLAAGDDFAAFMAKEVPQHLKNKALRVLWRSNPVLACVDGLNDYDEDFHAAALAAEPIKTAYQVGKGMMAHIEEMARQQEAAQASALMPEPEEAPAEEIAQETVSQQPVVQDAEDPVMQAEAEPESDHDAPPRRMRFRFEEASV
ncbi:hypothetical protein ROLI_016700 [Roseobacter fucihabitans]|uniref:DUF3306 domain-containing protein n=1 Tax=Roseobacter fucihabitans TaxID=1537242 RepID=A0ABZ2BRG7_9RHOB|nr:DUF3306 domain-containing protein [Roseobacter litoralis]MBC6964455.1 hypothetical protein [Roseobacter litoralis]